MEKQSVLSRLKNKYLLIGLAIISPLLLIANAHQPKLTDVKGISVSVTVAPTETLTPTPVPADTPTPTLTPTNTPTPARVYVAPTTVYIPPTQAPATESNAQLDNNNYYTIPLETQFTVRQIRSMVVSLQEHPPGVVTEHTPSVSPTGGLALITEEWLNGSKSKRLNSDLAADELK